MNKIILKYLLKNFFITFIYIVLIFYSFGILLNLFEEIEFFKNLDVNIFLPLILTSIYMPSMIIQILPFIIFISSLWFMLKIRNNKDLLTLKVYGYSNLKILLLLAGTSFFLGWLILIVVNPFTASMSKYYEKTKSNYSRDIDHLITFNKNGLWIKENVKDMQRIISAERPEGYDLINVKIFHYNNEAELIEKIISKKVDISENNWKLENVIIFNHKDGIIKKIELEKYEINSLYDHNKITSLFKNFDTMSFMNIILNYKNLIKKGYNEEYLIQNLHLLLSMPFLLLLMTGLASIFTMNTLRKSDNLKLVALALVTSVLTFYFKDLFLALGKTGRIPLILAVWSPVLALSLFTLIGILQINEK